MSILSYNGINLQVCRFLRGCERTPIFDGPMYLYTRWRILCRCLYNPQATSYDFPVNAQDGGQPMPTVNLPAVTDTVIRHRLMEPREQLILGVGNVAWLVSPQQGFTVDSANGPRPFHLHIIKGPGGRSFVVDFGIETCLRECNLERHNYPSIFLSHRWEMEHRMDEDFYTSRIIKGHVIFDTAKLAEAPVVPDQYRGTFFHPIPPNCQRRIPVIRQHPDGNSVEYVIVDEEQQLDLGVDCTSAGITRLEASLDVDTTGPGWGKAALALARIALQGARSAFEISAAARIAAGGAEPGDALGIEGGFRAAAGMAAAGINFPIGLALGTAGQLATELETLLPMQTKTVTVTAFGNRTSTKRNLLGVAQLLADGIMARVAVVIPVIFQWKTSVHLDMKRRQVAVVKQVVHVPNFVTTSLPVDIISGLLGVPAWPEINAADDVTPNGFDGIRSRDLGLNARPPGDTISRGTFLELLTAQTLTDPCQNQPFPVAPRTVARLDTGDGIVFPPVNFGPAISAFNQNTTPT